MCSDVCDSTYVCHTRVGCTLHCAMVVGVVCVCVCVCMCVCVVWCGVVWCICIHNGLLLVAYPQHLASIGRFSVTLFVRNNLWNILTRYVGVEFDFQHLHLSLIGNTPFAIVILANGCLA